MRNCKNGVIDGLVVDEEDYYHPGTAQALGYRCGIVRAKVAFYMMHMQSPEAK